MGNDPKASVVDKFQPSHDHCGRQQHVPHRCDRQPDAEARSVESADRGTHPRYRFPKMNTRGRQHPTPAARRRGLPAVVDWPALAFALICDGVDVQPN
jgi:hypothetical protein